MEDLDYKWEIWNLSKKTINGVDEVIFNVVWSKIGVDSNGLVGEYKISTDLVIDETLSKDENFIEFETLTKETIVSWIKNLMNEEEVNSYIFDQIQLQKDNISVVPYGEFPWQTN